MLSQPQIVKCRHYSGMISFCLLHPVGSMQPLEELTFLHKNPAVSPIGLYITIISLSVAALDHAAILVEIKRFLIDFIETNICFIKCRYKLVFPSDMNEIF